MIRSRHLPHGLRALAGTLLLAASPAAAQERARPTAVVQAVPPTPPAPPTPPVPPTPPTQPEPPEARYRWRQTPGHVQATTAVRGTPTFRMRTLSADIRITSGPAGRATIHIYDGRVPAVKLLQHGDRLEPDLGDEQGGLRHGYVEVELPPGVHLDLNSVSGDIESRAQHGDVRIKAVSGDVRLESASTVEIKTVSGDVRVGRASGRARLKTVSGDVDYLSAAGPAAQLEFETTSGGLDWRGACGKGCRLELASMSGDIRLTLEPRSSFELSYTSHSGELRDQLGVTPTEQRKRSPGGQRVQARYGGGEGEIEYSSFSGELQLRKK